MSTLKATNLQNASSASVNIALDSSGNATVANNLSVDNDLKFDSGYGSTATAYGVRAWCRWSMSGTQSIYNSRNVSSLTDNGTGQSWVNFTTAMPDANYAVSGNRQYRGTFNFEGQTASLAKVYSAEVNGTLYDSNECTMIVVR